MVDSKKLFCECEATSELPHLGTLRRDIDQEKSEQEPVRTSRESENTEH